MKVFILLVLLALTTSFDAAIIQEAGGIEGEKLEKDMNPAVLKKAGKSVETLGKILQGDISFKSAEEKYRVVDSITGEPVVPRSIEEFFGILIAKALAIGVTRIFGAVVEKAIEKNQTEREG